MIEITFTTPWPPSVNQLYTTSAVPRYSQKKQKYYYPRHLCKKGYEFKKYVVELLNYTFPKVRYGSHPVKIYIVYRLPLDKRKRDVHNVEKILFDSIKASGIIDDDDQIVKWTFDPGKKCPNGELEITMKPYHET